MSPCVAAVSRRKRTNHGDLPVGPKIVQKIRYIAFCKFPRSLPGESHPIDRPRTSSREHVEPAGVARKGARIRGQGESPVQGKRVAFRNPFPSPLARMKGEQQPHPPAPRYAAEPLSWYKGPLRWLGFLAFSYSPAPFILDEALRAAPRLSALLLALRRLNDDP